MAYGHAEAKRAARKQVMQAAYQAHPERFPHSLPAEPSLPHEVWINKPLTVAGAALAEMADQHAPTGVQAVSADASKLLVLAAPSGNPAIQIAQ